MKNLAPLPKIGFKPPPRPIPSLLARGHILTLRALRSMQGLTCELRDYRERRENGDKIDNPKEAFPSAGFDALKIKSSTHKPDGPKGEDYWPDKQGRYWWRLTLEDGTISEDYYWMADKVRGFPDKADDDRYWLSVHHAPSGIKIEGFSARPDREKGYPDKSGNYWSYIQYDECGPIQQWMEEKDRNYAARLQREEQQANVAALRAAEEKQRQEQAAEQLRFAERKRLEDRKDQEGRRMLKMKTQSYGRSGVHKCPPQGRRWIYADEPMAYQAMLMAQSASALKDYREQRENGDKIENPKKAFPAVGFDTLKIKHSICKPTNYFVFGKEGGWLVIGLMSKAAIGGD